MLYWETPRDYQYPINTPLITYFVYNYSNYK
jgi:hypothetical protein